MDPVLCGNVGHASNAGAAVAAVLGVSRDSSRGGQLFDGEASRVDESSAGAAVAEVLGGPVGDASRAGAATGAGGVCPVSRLHRQCGLFGRGRRLQQWGGGCCRGRGHQCRGRHGVRPVRGPALNASATIPPNADATSSPSLEASTTNRLQQWGGGYGGRRLQGRGGESTAKRRATASQQGRGAFGQSGAFIGGAEDSGG